MPKNHVRVWSITYNDYLSFAGETKLDFAGVAVALLLGAEGTGKTNNVVGLSHTLTGVAYGLTDRTGKALRPIANFNFNATKTPEITVGLSLKPDATGPEVFYTRRFGGLGVKDQAVRILNGHGFCCQCGLPPSEPTKTKKKGCTCTYDSLEQWFYAETCSFEQWRLLFNAARFYQFTTDEMVQFITSLAAGGFTETDLWQALEGRFEDKTLIPLAKDILSKRKGDPREFDAVAGWLIKQRPDANKMVVELEGLLKKSPVAYDKKRLETLQLEVAALKGKVRAAQEKVTILQSLGHLMLEKAIADYQHPDLKSLQAAVDAAKAEQEKQKKIVMLNPTALVQQANDAMMAAASSQGKQCDICGTTLGPEHVAYAKHRLTDLEGELKQWEKWQGKLRAAEVAVTKAETDLQKARDLIAEYGDKSKRYEDTIEKYEGVTWTAPEMEEKLRPLDRELLDLQTAAGAEQGRKDTERLLATARHKQQAILTLIEAYEPQGIRAHIKADEGFVSSVETAIKMLFGEKAIVDLPNQRIALDGQNFRQFTDNGISTGQGKMLGLAVQLGIMRATGVYVLCIDETAEVNPATWKAILSILVGTLTKQVGDKRVAVGTALVCRQIPDHCKYKPEEIDVAVKEYASRFNKLPGVKVFLTTNPTNAATVIGS
jgi:hypothetical protein